MRRGRPHQTNAKNAVKRFQVVTNSLIPYEIKDILYYLKEKLSVDSTKINGERKAEIHAKVWGTSVANWFPRLA